MSHRMDSTNDEGTMTATEARVHRQPEVVLARCERCGTALHMDPATPRPLGRLAPNWCPNGHGLRWQR